MHIYEESLILFYLNASSYGENLVDVYLLWALVKSAGSEKGHLETQR
jgi:hypothetical protein